MNESRIRNVIEAALLAAGKSLQPAELVELFDEGARPPVQDIQAALTALMAEYENRGIEIKETAAGFRIQVRPAMANEISRLWPERPAKYSRALLETLALIAYRQPITRAEIEAVRGVAVNPNILKTVIERNWVRVVGHRDVPGRPELLGTTRDFLDYFGLKSLDDLPALAELKSIGEIKVQFDLPDPGPLSLALDGAVADGAATDGNAADGAAHDGTAAVITADAAEAGNAAAVDAVGEGVGPDAAKSVRASDASEVDTTAEGVSTIDADAESAVAADTAVADVAGAASITSGEPAAEEGATVASTGAAGVAVAIDESGADAQPDVTAANDGKRSSIVDGNKSKKSKKSRRGTAASARHDAEEFAASVDADLAAGDDDGSDDDELSAEGSGSHELVAGPRDIDD
jgi:segregation and condensation protein B